MVQNFGVTDALAKIADRGQGEAHIPDADRLPRCILHRFVAGHVRLAQNVHHAIEGLPILDRRECLPRGIEDRPDGAGAIRFENVGRDANELVSLLDKKSGGASGELLQVIDQSEIPDLRGVSQTEVGNRLSREARRLSRSPALQFALLPAAEPSWRTGRTPNSDCPPSARRLAWIQPDLSPPGRPGHAPQIPESAS